MNVLLAFALMVFSWSIDKTDPAVQRVIFLTFLVIHGAIIAPIVYIFVKIYRRADHTKVQVKDGDEVRTEQVWEYDFGKLRDLALAKIGVSSLIGLFAARRLGIPFPLIFQCVMNPLALWQSELCKVYLRGYPATGPLARPWGHDSFVPDWLKSIWRSSDIQATEFLSDPKNTIGTAGNSSGGTATSGRAGHKRR